MQGIAAFGNWKVRLLYFIELNLKIKHCFRYKLVVADAIIQHVGPIRERIFQYLNDKQYLLDLLFDNSAKVANIAENTTREVRLKLGIRPCNKVANLSMANK